MLYRKACGVLLLKSACQPNDSGKDSGMVRFYSTLFAVMLLLGLSACSASSDIHETRFMMGTLVQFTIIADNADKAKAGIAAAAAQMQHIEDEFTIYGDNDNAVKRFNASAPGTWVRLPDEIASLLQRALSVKRQSKGAFDPVLGQLNLLWGFSIDPPSASPPDKGAIQAAIPPAHCIQHQGKQWRRLDARCTLDFGGIAKGYAIDQGIAMLKKYGIHNAIINAGGDIRLIGAHGKRPWHIGIRHPRDKNAVIATLDLQGDVSIVTSGDYERFYIYHGKRYHHLLDPKTGWPADRAQSATVIAANATLADAWSTAMFVRGADGLADLSQHEPDIQVLWMDQHGQQKGHLDGAAVGAATQ